MLPLADMGFLLLTLLQICVTVRALNRNWNRLVFSCVMRLNKPLVGLSVGWLGGWPVGWLCIHLNVILAINEVTLIIVRIIQVIIRLRVSKANFMKSI